MSKQNSQHALSDFYQKNVDQQRERETYNANKLQNPTEIPVQVYQAPPLLKPGK